MTPGKRMVFFLLLQNQKNKKFEVEMRKKGTLKASGADVGAAVDLQQLYGELVLHESGLSHSQVTAVDVQEVNPETDAGRSGPVMVPASAVQSTSSKLK